MYIYASLFLHVYIIIKPGKISRVIHKYVYTCTQKYPEETYTLSGFMNIVVA